MSNHNLLTLLTFGTLLIVVRGVVVLFSTEEEITPNVFLGNIADNIAANETNIFVGDLSNINISFTILGEREHDYRDYFTIKQNSDVYLVRKINREEICQQKAICKMKVIISATYGIFLEFVHVNLTVLDINDNFPTFPEAVLNLSIPEGTAIRTSYSLRPATDLDSGINSIQRYILEPASTDFELEMKLKDDDSPDVSLILNLTLDRESSDNYQLYVKAIDDGSTSFTGTLTVNIIVTDINDNQPTFQPTEYNATIDENIETNTEVLTVTAIDRDIGENKRLAYYFADTAIVTVGQYFGIEETSGLIYVNHKLDSVRPFMFFVEVKDHGNPYKTSQAKVTINIRDMNDNRPDIKIIPSSNINVQENQSVTTRVALVIVTDEDNGLNGEAECECFNSKFTIIKVSEAGQNTFSLVTMAVLDRETQDSYSVEINCSDHGQPPLSSNVTFIVTIKDENDHAPIFGNTLYDADVTENNHAGAVLLRVTASDLDINENGRIRYEIESFNDANMFNIEPSSGIIKAAQSFDRETKDTYTFIVYALDQGPNPHNVSARVTINVKDENDNSPSFIGDSYAMSILENSNISNSLGTVTATDPDLGDNGSISYMIPSEYASYPFAILDDGTVITTQVLDREGTSSYQFNVTVSDHGHSPRSNNIPVYVTVLDENDNAPFVEFPYGDNDTVSVAHNTEANSVIASILADDDDEKENKRLSYSILGGNNENLFDIETDTGHIFLTKRISNGDIKQFALTISVKDNGVTQKETRATLNVRFYLAHEDSGTTMGSNGQNILIAIVISCVTFILSVIIITIICIIRKKDKTSSLYNAKSYDEQKIIEDHRNSNRSSSSRGSGDKMLYSSEKAYMENGYAKKAKKEVSFIVEEDQDTGMSVEMSGTFDPVSTFKSPSPVPSKSTEYGNYSQQETSPTRSDRSDEMKQREIHRMTSLRVHQALIQSQNNNNNNKQWPQSPTDETARTYIGLMKRHNLDDSHSETSGETITSDSGRGGSEEDVRSNMTVSHDTDESRSPNTSTSHPFYMSENRQPTFSSFHGNSVHKTGPILSSFLKQKQKRQQNEDSHKNSYPMNDLSNPHRNNVYSQYRHPSESNVPPPLTNMNSGPIVPPAQNTIDFDPLLHSSRQSNLNIGNSFENESITGRSQDDDNTTTTSGSYTINDLQDDILAVETKDMFYKPDTFV